MTATVRAPWSPAIVTNLRAWQAAGYVHPLTCERSIHGPLDVSPTGLRCKTCGYLQTWAPEVVAIHGPPPPPGLVKVETEPCDLCRAKGELHVPAKRGRRAATIQCWACEGTGRRKVRT